MSNTNYMQEDGITFVIGDWNTLRQDGDNEYYDLSQEIYEYSYERFAALGRETPETLSDYRDQTRSLIYAIKSKYNTVIEDKKYFVLDLMEHTGYSIRDKLSGYVQEIKAQSQDNEPYNMFQYDLAKYQIRIARYQKAVDTANLLFLNIDYFISLL